MHKWFGKIPVNPQLCEYACIYRHMNHAKVKMGRAQIRSSCVSGKLTILPKPDIQIKILDKSLYLLELRMIFSLCKHNKKNRQKWVKV